MARTVIFSAEFVFSEKAPEGIASLIEISVEQQGVCLADTSGVGPRLPKLHISLLTFLNFVNIQKQAVHLGESIYCFFVIFLLHKKLTQMKKSRDRIYGVLDTVLEALNCLFGVFFDVFVKITKQ